MKSFLTLLFSTLLIGVVSLSALHPAANAASAQKIDANVNETLDDFVHEIRGGQALLNKARGVLVMPKVYKAGLGVGGQYGEGALRVNGQTVDYYNLVAGSFGFQLGGQKKSMVILFMEDTALRKFRESKGFKVGVDASIAVITVGGEGELDSNTLNKPIMAFVIDQQGLMYDLSLEGAKFSKVVRR